MKILFYDLNLVLIDRYPRKIAEQLSAINSELSFVFVYSENTKIKVHNRLPNNSQMVYMPYINEKTLSNLFLSEEIRVVVTCAQRLSDMLFIAISRRHNIPSFTVQHGIWSSSINRLPWFRVFFTKLNKFIFYINRALELASIIGVNRYFFLRDAYNFFYLDKSQLTNFECLNSDYLRADMVLAFDESWIDYYVGKFGYKEEQIFFIGNPDFLLLSNPLECEANSVGYICQSLVEDGRLDRNTFIRFLHDLQIMLNSEVILYIKLHPRSDESLYRNFFNLKNVRIIKEFPLCNRYIGHYSSLLAVTDKVGRKNLLWKLEGHYIPENFLRYGSKVSSDLIDLKFFLNCEQKVESCDDSIFPKNPYVLAAQRILMQINRS